MFVAILLASLFEGTAKNHNFQASDAYSLPTTRRKFVKTRFFVLCALIYTILATCVVFLVLNRYHETALELLGADEARLVDSWLIPACQRTLAVISSSYYRELVLLLAFLCYDRDANTSISLAVLIAFLPTLGLSLVKQAVAGIPTGAEHTPYYLALDDDSFHFANEVCLLAAHFIMYLAWIKTLRVWFGEQDLFKMRYNLLADKYNRDMAHAAAEAAKQQKQRETLAAEVATSQQSALLRQPLIPESTEPTVTTPSQMPVLVSQTSSDRLDMTSRAHTAPAKIRKLSADGSGTQIMLSQFPEARKSVQNLVSSSLIRLDSRGQSVESTSMVSVYQQKIGTPTIIPIDDGTECFSYVGKTINLWTLVDRRRRLSFDGHSQPVSKIKPLVVPEGRFGLKARRLEGSLLDRTNLLISASWDGTIKLWEVETGHCLATIEGKMGGITAINTWDDNTKLIAGSSQGMIKGWDLQTHEQIGDSYQQSPMTVSAVGVWEDRSKFFAASFDGNAYVWNLTTRRCEKILKKHTKRILDAVLYDSDTRLITASEDTLLVIWDLEQGTVLRVLEGHSSPVHAVAVYGDSQRAISGSTDGQLIAWDIYTDNIAEFIVSSLDDHTAAIISIHVFEGGLNKMYTHSMDRKLRIWDMEANACEQTIDMPPPSEYDTPSLRSEPEIPLDILIAWDPRDGLALSSTILFIQNLGHFPTVSKSSAEFLTAFTAPSSPRFHIVLLDLGLPGLDDLDAHSVVAQLNAAGSKLVLLATAEMHSERGFPRIVESLKSTPGFMELTEKPLTELSLAKILHEVAGGLHSPAGPFAYSPGPLVRSPDPSRQHSASLPATAMANAVMRDRGAAPSPSPPTERRSSLPGSTLESQVQNMQERLSYVETLFACFVPVQFFEMISPKGRDRTQLGDAVVKSVTVLFSDIRDFSTMSESMAVSELMEFLNAYLAFAMPPIQENGGFVDKFIGDSIMALFSQDGTQQCISAVNCAISMMYHLDGLQDNGFTQVNTGIGINTGRMIIGLVGVETRMEPTVLGDAVNLASRLESLCKVYDSRVIISEYTREKMGRSAELYTMRELDFVAVKGKRLACRIYEILEAERREPQKGKRMLLKDGLWDKALHAFRKGDFSNALTLFGQCQAINPQDKPTKFYITRTQEAMAKGIDAQSWDSTHRLAAK